MVFAVVIRYVIQDFFFDVWGDFNFSCLENGRERDTKAVLGIRCW